MAIMLIGICMTVDNDYVCQVLIIIITCTCICLILGSSNLQFSEQAHVPGV